MTEVRSEAIGEGLQETRDRTGLDVKVTSSVEEIFDELRRIDEEREGSNYILKESNAEEGTHWMVYKHNVTLGPVTDEKISYEESMEVEELIRNGEYDEAERQFKEYAEVTK